MATLKEQLLNESTRPALVADCVTLINAEVASKGGLGGLAIKGAYKTIKAIKPTFVSGVIDALLDEWIDKLEPYHSEWAGEGAFTSFITARRGPVANSLLEVTDGRADKTKHKTAKKLYRKLRPSAARHVGDAVPRLAETVTRHLTT